MEALRLAVHRPEEVAELLHEVLFVDPVVLAGYRALCASTTLAQAIDAADEESATLLRRLAVEDADTAAADVLALLARGRIKRGTPPVPEQAIHEAKLTREALER